MSRFHYENHRGSPTLTLLNVLGALVVINVLNVLNMLNVLDIPMIILNYYQFASDWAMAS